MHKKLYVSTRKGLFTLELSSRGWSIHQTSFLADNVNLVYPDARTGSLFAALDHGHFGVKLHRSHDGGQTWQEMAVPTYPPQPEGTEDKDGGGKVIPWKLMKIWALEASPKTLWCGTIPGGLFRSEDRGDSWQLVESLWNHPGRKQWFGGGADYPGIHSICIDPGNPHRVAVGVSCGGVWLTEDDGQSWNCRSDGMYANYMPPNLKFEPGIQDVHRVVQCPAAPDVFWAQHHNGVFHTTDGLKSWHDVPNVPPSTFGFAVAVHPRDPDIAWFVPAQLDQKRIPVDGCVVAARTRDGGKSFTLLTNGLPQSHAYDLVYRHSLDVDDSGENLAFGSTTGNLWTSDDEGNNWTEISHLPPIYAVRFAP